MPGVVPAIKDTITTPVPPDVDTEMLELFEKLLEKPPRSVVNVTVVPSLTGLPELSSTVAVIVNELSPSAGMLVGSAVSVIDPPSPSSTPPPQEIRNGKISIKQREVTPFRRYPVFISQSAPLLKIDVFVKSLFNITQAIKYLNIVIPAKAGIQVGTGCRIKSGMTELDYLVARLIYHFALNLRINSWLHFQKALQGQAQ